ncbi:hypothetical protein [uncultured Pontibacter sp.]|uniref:hypothetical protein n=1 Tax=uncultured Pontibacter sp. TaxID=453356 RepID=UPI002625C255|nr:hypothetical protein [uncultured Pontibacter sp.]
MKNVYFIVTFTLLLSLTKIERLYAHGGEKHGEIAKTEEEVQQSDTSALPTVVTPETHAAHRLNPETVHARPDDFPNRHPLFVHFPIVLLLVAAAVQLANIFFLRKSLDWVVTISVLVSFAAAYYVTKIDHPHTSGLSEHAKLVLAQHDFYADWTIYLAGTGLVAQVLSQFLFKGKRWSVLVVALVLTGAAYYVAMAGHYGAQLVHIEGVGPQGKYLQTDHH